MDTNTQNNQQTDSQNNQNANSQNTQNNGSQSNQYTYQQPKTNYPRRRSSASIILGVVLILMGASYVVDKFFPWLFNWIDSGLIIAVVAIVVGFFVLIRK